VVGFASQRPGENEAFPYVLGAFEDVVCYVFLQPGPMWAVRRIDFLDSIQVCVKGDVLRA
jgi:hypothetical protein